MEAAQEALYMLSALEQAGYEAYLVGGCVRDALLGQPPKDYDIATQARPPQATEALEAAGCRVHPTGIAHGTVTAVYRGLAVEVTAYRRDGEYLDHRHPSQVRFVNQLQEDLLRRDFTCNALAFHPDRGLVDLVGGLPDLRAGLLRCVGDPLARFEEDALRVLRALRFASVLGFAIEAETAAAVHQRAALLQSVARERISAELLKLVCGKQAESVLGAFWDVLAVCLPGLAETPDAQKAACLERLSSLPPDPLLRLYPLLRWSASPEEDLRALRLSARQQESLRLLLALGEQPQSSLPQVRRLLGKQGEERARLLLTLQGGQALPLLERCLQEGLCCSLSQLALGGRELLGLGLQGPRVGEALDGLLEFVIEGKLPNDRAALLEAARRWME